MSIFGDDGVDDLLNGNINNDVDQLPDDADDNPIFGDGGDQEDGENAEGAVGVPVKVQPKKRSVNPRPRLNLEVLRGPRGLHTIEDYYKDIKFKGKGHEREDLDEVMRRLQHWGHRMYPTYKFDDVLTNIDRLGKKKALHVHMSRYRLGMLESMKNHGEINDAADEDEQAVVAADEPFDEFDALLDEQIAISKVAPRTPGPSTSRYSSGGIGSSTNTSIASSSNFATPSFSRGNAVMSTPYTGLVDLNDISDLATPLPPSQPSTPATKQQLSAEQMARIAENRRLAQERLAAKKLAQQEAQKPLELTEV